MGPQLLKRLLAILRCIRTAGLSCSRLAVVLGIQHATSPTGQPCDKHASHREGSESSARNNFWNFSTASSEKPACLRCTYESWPSNTFTHIQAQPQTDLHDWRCKKLPHFLHVHPPARVTKQNHGIIVECFSKQSSEHTSAKKCNMHVPLFFAT